MECERVSLPNYMRIITWLFGDFVSRYNKGWMWQKRNAL